MFRRRSLPVFLLGVVLGCAGCTTAPPRAAAPVHSAARLTVTNLSGYTWSLVVRAPDEQVVQTIRVTKRGDREVLLEPGDYAIEQTLLEAGVAAEPTRRVTVHFEAGQHYAWSLATLLSPLAAAASPEVGARE